MCWQFYYTFILVRYSCSTYMFLCTVTEFSHNYETAIIKICWYIFAMHNLMILNFQGL